ncbi:orofacial cleft 1 candidate gene 1 protein [Trachemys scripta elegans]|uniref:orofacial cleft 1 candidate gene 1 protein n=1 Tax=Trachemys scripta elegans TaxID=31138 RepID=UPI001555C9C8|nr:orofacial cleft 1 candidate gene 1 protein [Trachemys scripta elegans]
MDREKFQQKALKQTKQKKSKSAEFLMVKEEKAATEGIENPAFNISSIDLSAYQTSEEKVIRHDKLDSTLAAHQQKLRLQAHAEPRGNEYSRNYFDPVMDEEINPRQSGMEVSGEGEAELMPMNLDEKILYGELMKLLDEENKMVEYQAAHVICEDFSDSVRPVSFTKTLDLRKEVEDEGISPYIEQFEKDVQDDIILLGSFALEQLSWQSDFSNLLYKGKMTPSLPPQFWRVAEPLEETSAHDLKVQKEVLHHNKQMLHTRFHKPFQRIESQPLQVAQNARKHEIAAKFGNLAEVNNESNGAAGLCWKVDRYKTPQPIQIQLRCLRGAKDKVPKGRYTLKVSLLSRLGGSVLKWSELKEQQWAAMTLPISHDGNFYDVEICFDQSVYTVLPARKEVKPGMILLFELFLLHETNTYIDRVVGWGAFPLCDNNFNTLQGKFKCPFLRGHYDSKFDRFKKIENLISLDLDHWLCNLYFQIIKLPWYSDEQKTYETCLQLSPEFLAYSNITEKNGDSDKIKISGPQDDGFRSSCLHPGTRSKCSLASFQGQPLTSWRDPDTHKGSIPTVVKEVGKQFNAVKGREECVSKETGRKREELSLKCFQQAEEAMDEFKLKVKDQKKPQQKGSYPCQVISSGSHKYYDLVPMKEDQGISYKVSSREEQMQKSSPPFIPGITILLFLKPSSFKMNQSDPIDQQCQGKSSPGTSVAAGEGEASSPNAFYLDELEKYRFSVCCHSTVEVRVSRRIIEHFHFGVYGVFSELGLVQWRSWDFWFIMLLVVLLWFVRLYLHYCSQWLVLQAISVPVAKFQLFPHTVELCYQNSLLLTREELAMVVVGPLTLNAVMLLMVLIRWGCQQLFDSFPSFLSKFIMAMGLWTVLDPLAVFVVDAFLGRLTYRAEKPIADAAKLYWLFSRTEQSGIPGALITMMLYTILFIISSTVLSLYFLRLHNEGWLLDVFKRTHSDEGTFFIPLDLEISNQELSYIMKKAEQWRGINGERRKVAVYDYIWKDNTSKSGVSSYDLQHQDEISECEAHSGEITVHVSIYTVHLSGFQDLYRQFLRLPDGAIVEAFDNISGVSLLYDEVSTTIQEHLSEMDNVLGASSVIKRRERKKNTARWKVFPEKPQTVRTQASHIQVVPVN